MSVHIPGLFVCTPVHTSGSDVQECIVCKVCTKVHSVHSVHRMLISACISCTLVNTEKWIQLSGVQCAYCVQTVQGAWGPSPHVPARDTGRGYEQSDFTTCLPVTWRHGSQLYRSNQALLRVLIFSFSVRRTILHRP